jgi:hypothetical protein
VNDSPHAKVQVTIDLKSSTDYKRLQMLDAGCQMSDVRCQMDSGGYALLGILNGESPANSLKTKLTFSKKKFTQMPKKQLLIKTFSFLT